ncbi:MAG: metal-sensitive transcriptional regulator [Candidatus Taylorbacteria bacterium]|nr:metal-sensitive transcriptional regulator [Candidatus Taylorbacteria bacterium]
MKKQFSKEALLRRLKIVEGQVRGLAEMIESDVYCIDVITQTSAVKQALSGIEDAVMENHLSTCAIDQVKAGEEDKAKEEILKVYRLKRR